LKIARRAKHEPIAYILGHKEFFGLEFRVDENTLIPRPETELLIEEVLQEFQDTRYNPEYSGQNTKIIDVGTGSGNIIVSLAKNLESKKIKFVGIDISEKALRIAKQNAKKNKVDKKIKFLKGSLLEPFKKYSLLTTHYSLLILANLPYLSKKIYSSTPVDVKKYEPKSALISGTDGLNHYKKLFKQIKKIYVSCFMLNVTCFVEISPEQKPRIQKLIKIQFPEAKIEFKKDLAGKWRLLVIKL